MTETKTGNDGRDEEFDRIIKEYYEAVERGTSPTKLS